MIKHFLLVFTSSIFLLICCIFIIRLSNGKQPYVSLVQVKYVLEGYNNPHATEYVLTHNYFDKFDMSTLDYSLWYGRNPDGTGGGFSSGSSYGGGGGGSRSRGSNKDSRNDPFNLDGLDWSDLVTLPAALIYDVAYNVYYCVAAINLLVTLP